MPILSHVQLVVLRPLVAPQRMVDQWADGLKTNAERVNQKRKAVIGNDTNFQSKLASPSNQEFAPFVNPGFVSRAGLSNSEIIDKHKDNLKQAFDKYNDKLDFVFETVEGVFAKRYKDRVDLTTGSFSKGVAKRTLPFTGIKVEGRGPAAIAGLWLVDDPMAERLIRGGDNVLEGGPFLITYDDTKAALKAALTQRITQAGNAIIRSDYAAPVFTAQNDLTNKVVQGLVDPALGIEAFATGGASRVDFIRINNDLFLEIQVSVV